MTDAQLRQALREYWKGKPGPSLSGLMMKWAEDYDADAPAIQPQTSPESQSEPDWKAVAEQAKAAGDKVLQDAKVSRAQLQVPYSQAHRDFVDKHGWPTQPAIQPQRMSETTDNAIKALTGLFSILRGKSFAKDHYQLEISHGLYNELRDVRDRLVAERTAALTRPKLCPTEKTDGSQS